MNDGSETEYGSRSICHGILRRCLTEGKFVGLAAKAAMRSLLWSLRVQMCRGFIPVKPPSQPCMNRQLETQGVRAILLGLDDSEPAALPISWGSPIAVNVGAQSYSVKLDGDASPMAAKFIVTANAGNWRSKPADRLRAGSRSIAALKNSELIIHGRLMHFG